MLVLKDLHRQCHFVSRHREQPHPPTALPCLSLVIPPVSTHATYTVLETPNPHRLEAVKQKVRLARATSPLFNIREFCSHLERVYERIWSKFRAGKTNEHVTDLTLRTLPSDRLLCTEPFLKAVSPDEYYQLIGQAQPPNQFQQQQQQFRGSGGGNYTYNWNNE